MSREAMEWALTARTGDPTRKLILSALGKHAGKDGAGAWASTETLAEYAECSARTAQRHILTLLEGGLVREGDPSVVPDYIPKRRRPIVYDLAMDAETATEWAGAWAAGDRTGRRAAASAVGAAAGRKGAPRRAEVRAVTQPWGVTGDTPLEHETGDTGDTPSTRGDMGDTPLRVVVDPRGVTGGVSSGVSPVTPKQELKPRTKDLRPLRAADASAGSGELPLDLDPPPAKTTDPVQVLVGVYVKVIQAQGGVVSKSRAAAIGSRAKKLIESGVPMERLVPAFEAAARAGNLDFDRFLASPNGSTFPPAKNRPAQGFGDRWSDPNSDFYGKERAR